MARTSEEFAKRLVTVFIALQPVAFILALLSAIVSDPLAKILSLACAGVIVISMLIVFSSLTQLLQRFMPREFKLSLYAIPKFARFLKRCWWCLLIAIVICIAVFLYMLFAVPGAIAIWW